MPWWIIQQRGPCRALDLYQLKALMAYLERAKLIIIIMQMGEAPRV